MGRVTSQEGSRAIAARAELPQKLSPKSRSTLSETCGPKCRYATVAKAAYSAMSVPKLPTSAVWKRSGLRSCAARVWGWGWGERDVRVEETRGESELGRQTRQVMARRHRE